jgi:hypothetical protein
MFVTNKSLYYLGNFDILKMLFEDFKCNAMTQLLPPMIPAVTYPQMLRRYEDVDNPVGIKPYVNNIMLLAKLQKSAADVNNFSHVILLHYSYTNITEL